MQKYSYLLPQHEYFHQLFVLADCENELIRDPSRGLEGGAFFLATLLNRKEAKAGKGKNSFNELKDFMLLKGDARFCHCFLNKFGLDPDQDNTPENIKNATTDIKVKYIHDMVSEALLDLLPYYATCLNAEPLPLDYPLQNGRRRSYNNSNKIGTRKCALKLEEASFISNEVVCMTAGQVVDAYISDEMIVDNMNQSEAPVSSTRKSLIFSCKLCSFETKLKTLCKTHVEECLKLKIKCPDNTTAYNDTALETKESSTLDRISLETLHLSELEKEDLFWNYKNAEFFLDSLMGVSDIYEKYGDGLGFFITNKILLPIFHGLKHSNYSCSIHRFITRVLCEATPLEGSKLIHERFSNRSGKSGHNICRDRRMEYRIGATKRHLGNLGGTNFSEESAMKTNKSIDIKEQLFYNTRKTHGVDIRRGRHNPRSDGKDYEALFYHLTETRAHMKLPGRTFGDISYPANILDDELFDKSAFYRWLIQKNNEANSVLGAKA